MAEQFLGQIEKFFANIPDTAISKDDKFTPDICVICLEPVSERAIAVPCNHWTFDFICIVSWLQEQDRCPLCKTRITAIEYDWRSPSDHKTFLVAAQEEPKKGHQSNSNTSSHSRQRRRSVSRRYANNVADPAIARRRSVYRNDLYSLHIGNNSISRYRNLTPQTFATDNELQSRARRWIRRELQVFTFLSDTQPGIQQPDRPAVRSFANAEYLLEYIIAMLKHVDIRGSDGKAEDLLSEFLGRRHAALFLHELESWLRSPFGRLQDWDEAVQYIDTTVTNTSSRKPQN